MKNHGTILLLIILAFFSCKKDSDDNDGNNTTVHNGISYPDSVFYGNNILSFPDSSVLLDGEDYEIGANLDEDASLFLVITNYPVIDSASGHSTGWFYSDAIGWTVGDYNDSTNTQIFTSIQSGKISSKIIFEAFGQTGGCQIDFYENGNTINETKHFFWH